jgi:hypothetical protein
MDGELDSRPLLSLSLSLSRLSSLFALLWQYSGTAMAFSPFHSFPFFFLALHTVSLGMRSRGTFPFGITVEGGKKESADDFERLYERKRTQMKQTGGMERRSTGPSSSLSLTDTSTFFFLHLSHARALSSCHHRATVPSPHDRHRCIYSKGTGKMV